MAAIGPAVDADEPSPGQIVIVTGTTGSGKTTTCQTFVAEADGLWLHFGVDLFFGKVVPVKFMDGGPRCDEGLHMVPDDQSLPDGPVHMALGRYGPGMVAAMHEMVAAASRAGQNVVMDHVTSTTPPLLQDCLARFKGLPVLLVALRPPIDTLGDRFVQRLAGIAAEYGEEHAARVNEGTRRATQYLEREIFRHSCFDLVLDSSALTPSEIVARINQRLAEGRGTAFPQLSARS
jgi:chloramphenicol 3-O-phosphotransferase